MPFHLPPFDVPAASRDPLDYFKRLYGDTVLNGAVHAMECGYKFYGPEHIVFATDYPSVPSRARRG